MFNNNKIKFLNAMVRNPGEDPPRPSLTVLGLQLEAKISI